jgi:hypothetical protein
MFQKQNKTKQEDMFEIKIGESGGKSGETCKCRTYSGTTDGTPGATIL